MNEFYCQYCGQKISIPLIPPEEKGICPRCRKVFIPSQNKPVHDFTLLDVPEELKSQILQADQPRAEVITAEQENKTYEQTSIKNKADSDCKLPWFIDIFLYPFNLAGVIHLIFLWLLLFLFCPLVIAFLGLGTEYIPVVYFLPVAYLLHYFAECIRDSAAGARRAPELHTSSAKPDRWDYISQLLTVVGSIAVCFWPVAMYYIVTERSDLIYWLLLACGGFFFPMTLLAVVLFDSFGALNPILIIGSIFRTLLPYCGMVLFFYAGALLFMEIDSPVNRFWLLPTVPFLIKGVQLYMIIFAVGLLGRFYHRIERKLNWEV